MTQARGSLRQIAYIAESTLGTTPGTPQMQLLEFVDFKGNRTAQSVTDPSINAYRQVTFSRPGNFSATAELDVVLCPDNYDDLLSAAMMADWATNVLKVGTVATAVRKSFSIEEGFTDMAQYHVYEGMVVNTMKITFPSDNSLVRANFGFVGLDATAFSGSPLDATPTAVTAKTKFFHEGGTMAIGGSTVGWVTSMELNLNNDFNPTYTFGDTAAYDLPFGNAEITGKVVGVFDSITEYNKYIAGTATSISTTLVAGAETLVFAMGQVKYTNGQIISSGDSGITVEFDFTAEYYPTDASALKITRT